MKRWTLRQLVALILGVVFALGTVVSTVQAADMAVKMSAAATVGAAGGPDGCAGACGGGDDAASMGSCVMTCPSSVQAIVPVASPIVMVEARTTRPLGEAASAGRFSPPDPYPPKPVVLI